MELDELPPISPLSFFSIHCDIPYLEEPSFSKVFKGKGLLPRFEGLCEGDFFAEVALAWNQEEFLIALEVDKPFEEAGYPDPQSGDSFEIFIDTRDLKSVNSFTRFCHHFFVLPSSVQEIQTGEITRLRADQLRPLADPQFIFVTAELEKKYYRLFIRINREAFCGYDPDQVPHLGFSYRVNRCGGEAQLFGSTDYKIETQPNHWASLSLIKK